MKVTLVCSCGLKIETGGSILYVDAPNAVCPPFSTMQPPDITPNVFFAFTHFHADHYDEAFMRNVPAAQIVTPEHKPDCPFFVEFFPIEHTPAPQFPYSEHHALTVSDGQTLLYVAGDAAPLLNRHYAALNGRIADAAFFHGQYLSYPETRELLRSCAKRSYIYHIPIDEADRSGIRRKCLKNMQRYGQELPNIVLLTEYPTEIPAS